MPCSILEKVTREYLTNSPSETKKLARTLAEKVLKKGPLQTKATIFALTGDLGGGKTTFLKGFAQGLGLKEKILSPSFVILKRFPLGAGQNSSFQNFYHLDCYRLENPKEILALDFKKIIANPKNIVAIEWADRISSLLPREITKLDFKFGDKKTRKITISC